MNNDKLHEAAKLLLEDSTPESARASKSIIKDIEDSIKSISYVTKKHDLSNSADLGFLKDKVAKLQTFIGELEPLVGAAPEEVPVTEPDISEPEEVKEPEIIEPVEMATEESKGYTSSLVQETLNAAHPQVCKVCGHILSSNKYGEYCSAECVADEQAEIARERAQEQNPNNMNEYERHNYHFPAGTKLVITYTPDWLKDSYPAANWVPDGETAVITLKDDATSGTADVYDVITEDGKEESIYGFSIVGRPLGINEN